MANHLIGLGLANNRDFVQRLLVAIKNKRTQVNADYAKPEDVELLTLKQFMKVFEYDKFGEKVCSLIRDEIAAKGKPERVSNVDSQLAKQAVASIGKVNSQVSLRTDIDSMFSPSKGSQISLLPAHKLMKSGKNSLTKAMPQQPHEATLAEKIAVIQGWFEIAKRDNTDATELSITEIGHMLVEKGLVSDIDTGIKTVLKALNYKNYKQPKDKKDEQMITFDIFQRVFVRAIFKESLIEVIHNIK